MMSKVPLTVSGEGFITDIPNLKPDFSQTGDVSEINQISQRVLNLLNKGFEKRWNEHVNAFVVYIHGMINNGSLSSKNTVEKALEKVFENFAKGEQQKFKEIEGNFEKALDAKVELARTPTKSNTLN